MADPARADSGAGARGALCGGGVCVRAEALFLRGARVPRAKRLSQFAKARLATHIRTQLHCVPCPHACASALARACLTHERTGCSGDCPSRSAKKKRVPRPTWEQATAPLQAEPTRPRSAPPAIHHVRCNGGRATQRAHAQRGPLPLRKRGSCWPWRGDCERPRARSRSLHGSAMLALGGGVPRARSIRQRRARLVWLAGHALRHKPRRVSTEVLRRGGGLRRPNAPPLLHAVSGCPGSLGLSGSQPGLHLCGPVGGRGAGTAFRRLGRLVVRSRRPQPGHQGHRRAGRLVARLLSGLLVAPEGLRLSQQALRHWCRCSGWAVGAPPPVPAIRATPIAAVAARGALPPAQRPRGANWRAPSRRERGRTIAAAGPLNAHGWAPVEAVPAKQLDPTAVRVPSSAGGTPHGRDGHLKGAIRRGRRG